MPAADVMRIRSRVADNDLRPVSRSCVVALSRVNAPDAIQVLSEASSRWIVRLPVNNPDASPESMRKPALKEVPVTMFGDAN